MAKIIIANKASQVPDCDEEDWHWVKRAFIQFGDVPQVEQDNQEWFTHELQRGKKTTTGAAIIAAIESGDRDVYIVPISSGFIGSQFEPAASAVVYDVMDGPGFLPAEKPSRMSPTVKLFHELGHAAQYATRKEWFEASAAASHKNRQKYFVEIERDNLVRHEWPISKELGEPTRFHYDDIHSTAKAAAKSLEASNAAALTIQRLWRANKQLQHLKASKATATTTSTTKT